MLIMTTTMMVDGDADDVDGMLLFCLARGMSRLLVLSSAFDGALGPGRLFNAAPFPPTRAHADLLRVRPNERIELLVELSRLISLEQLCVVLGHRSNCPRVEVPRILPHAASEVS